MNYSREENVRSYDQENDYRNGYSSPNKSHDGFDTIHEDDIATTEEDLFVTEVSSRTVEDQSALYYEYLERQQDIKSAVAITAVEDVVQIARVA